MSGYIHQPTLRVLGLTGGESDVLTPNITESGASEGGPETEEAAERATDTLVLTEGAVLAGPELEADDLVLGVAAGGDDDRAEDDADDEDNLEACKPELALAEHADRPAVEEGEEDNGDRDPCCRVDVWGPVADEDGNRGQLGGEEDDPEVPVEPAHRERHAVADVALCEAGISLKRKLAYAMWPPGMGVWTIISPRQAMTEKTRDPTAGVRGEEACRQQLTTEA